LKLPDAVYQVERVEQGRGDGHAAKNPRAAFFQAFEHQHPGGEVDPVGGQRQRLGEPAAAIGQGHAQGSDVTIGAFGFTQGNRRARRR
jgi:hypothetical protein